MTLMVLRTDSRVARYTQLSVHARDLTHEKGGRESKRGVY